MKKVFLNVSIFIFLLSLGLAMDRAPLNQSSVQRQDKSAQPLKFSNEATINSFKVKEKPDNKPCPNRTVQIVKRPVAPLVQNKDPIHYFAKPEVGTGCMASQGGNCILCRDRQYPANGFCVSVSLACGQYNPRNGVCITCAWGFYQDKAKVCRSLSRNCLQANQDGQCLKCASNYVIVSGKCQSSQPNIRSV